MLARFGEALGGAGVSLEGGGVFVMGGDWPCPFPRRGRRAWRGWRRRRRAWKCSASARRWCASSIRSGPASSGGSRGRLGEAGINIVTMYSDHANQLVLIVDDPEKGAAATKAWLA